MSEPRRRASDRMSSRHFWRQPVCRIDLIKAFLVASVIAGSAPAYTIFVQKRIVQPNQCHVLNRLAETKLFIRDFLRQSSPEDAAERKRFRIADAHLSQGLVQLERDIIRTPGCDRFRFLRERDRGGEPTPTDREG